jgi:hypothetical protein
MGEKAGERGPTGSRVEEHVVVDEVPFERGRKSLDDFIVKSMLDVRVLGEVAKHLNKERSQIGASKNAESTGTTNPAHRSRSRLLAATSERER